MPLGLFKVKTMAAANIVGVFWAAAMFAWFFLSALYMQTVLGYDPMQIGLAFLPSNLIMAVFSIWLAKMVMRFGIRMPIVVGMLLSAAGLGLFAFWPKDASFMLHVMPGMLLGIGCGMALNPVMLAAMQDVAPEESGLLGRRQHVVHDGRSPRARDPRKPVRARGLPRRVRARRPVRACRRGRGRLAAARGDSKEVGYAH